jgi:hypothetical protein
MRARWFGQCGVAAVDEHAQQQPTVQLGDCIVQVCGVGFGQYEVWGVGFSQFGYSVQPVQHPLLSGVVWCLPASWPGEQSLTCGAVHCSVGV